MTEQRIDNVEVETKRENIDVALVIKTKKTLKDLTDEAYPPAGETKVIKPRAPKTYDRFECYMIAVALPDGTREVVYYGGASGLGGVAAAMRQHEFNAKKYHNTEKKWRPRDKFQAYLYEHWPRGAVGNTIWMGLERARLGRKTECNALIAKWRKQAPQWPTRAQYPEDERAAHPYYCHSMCLEMANAEEWRGHLTACSFHPQGLMAWTI